MAVSLTSTGVNFVAGRGKNKMITLSMTFKELENWARKCGANMDQVIQRSFGRACSGLKQKFIQIMSQSGGVNGVPKFKDFDEFTKALRAVEGRQGVKLGAILAERYVAVAYKKNGWQIIGWPDRLATWAEKFQDGGDAEAVETFESDDFRRQMHLKGIPVIPRNYAKNPRRVLPQPFGDYVDKHLDEWARGAMYKGLARQFAKAAGGAV